MKRSIRLLSIALILLIVCSSFAFASTSNINQTTESDDNVISIKEASIIGLVFARAFLDSTMDTAWNGETKISNTTILYNADESISAYCFELENSGSSNGYIIVSATADKPLILEFSDESDPVFSAPLESQQAKDGKMKSAKIYYTGTLEYFIESAQTLKSIDNVRVEKNKLQDNFSKSNIMKKENNAIRKSIFGKIDENQISPFANQPGEAITDPIKYLNNLYGTGWVNVAYNNSLEGKVSGHRTGQGSLSNDCVVVSASTVLEYWKNYGGKNKLGNYAGIYSKAEEVLSEHPGWHSDLIGILPTTIDSFVDAILAKYNYYWSVDSVLQMSYSNVRSQITNGRPVMVNIGTPMNFYYGHSVAAYAWTYFEKPSSQMGYVNFLKVFDGWTTSARYVDFNALGSLYTITKIVP